MAGQSVIHGPCIYLVARRTHYTCTWGPWVRRGYRASRERGSDRERLFVWLTVEVVDGAVVVCRKKVEGDYNAAGLQYQSHELQGTL